MASDHPIEALLVAARGALTRLHFPMPGSNPKPQPQHDCLLHLHVVFANFLHKPLRSFTRCFRSENRRRDKPPPPLRHSGAGPPQQLELLLCIAFDALAHNLQVLDCSWKQKGKEFRPRLHQLEVVKKVIDGKKADFDGFLSNRGFAKVGVPPPPVGIMGTPPTASVSDEEGASVTGDKEGIDSASDTPQLPQRLPGRLLNIPLSNVERLRSTLSTVSLTELIELVPQLVGRSTTSSDAHPDKKKLFSVQDFFRYAEFEGKRFFEELDTDGDGQVTLEDLEVAMRKRRLPRKYARDFLRRTRSLPANEDNAAAMLRYLNADSEGSISYSHFRNFMLLLPSERLEDDPRNIWFEAATLVAVPPPVEISTESVLKSALAGGLASALSTSVMHPIDSMKTRVQASSLSFPDLISTLPQIGIRGLYRGSIPAILGQFSSHGLRTGIFEASKLVLKGVAPTLPDIQVQSLASFCSTILGTAVRIPCEVLKQRLQAGIFDNVGEAIVGTMQKDGPKGFFRGTGATLCREVPFYVAGMCLYAEAKKVAQHVLKRDLEPWETIAVGALSGGLAAVVTTPFDVMKTRMMTAPPGTPVSMQSIVFSILRNDGPLGLFKGAIPRFFWIAPLGAMNFAGYELAKKAMIQSESDSTDSIHDKRTTVGSKG
ncbi:hypothetical protein GUJ93_ZPchr0008g11786 [Zizania palustris]|uniref:EF-hand domain-containing protein n=1 Tax=Zizania palustris TaxID=103762 RepID=A0A8J5RYA0_ZIZPA|nr:hypothetical protein GUJ93_ZPchr0008g11786 [Zizania palustris]